MKPEVVEIQRDINQAVSMASIWDGVTYEAIQRSVREAERERSADIHRNINTIKEVIERGRPSWVGNRPKITRWDRARIWFMRLWWTA
jgi:hypothetical protein